MAEGAEAKRERSDTGAIDSSPQSVQDVQPSSPTISPTSPNDPTSSGQKSRQSRPGTSAGRKRKVPDSVTPNACTNCKKARAKCDGVKLACRRCVQRNIGDSCEYQVHAKTAKEQMIREIQRLQRKNESLEGEKDSLGKKNSWFEKIIRSIKDDGQAIEAIQRLQRGESNQAIAEWLGRSSVRSADQASSPATKHRISQVIEQYHQVMIENNDPRYWTNVSTEAELIEHLIKLYFTWIHPAHMLFDQEHFMSSFKACSDVYCSSALVNIICAMSCHLLHDTRDDDEETESGIQSLRTQFLNESKSLMKDADFEKMTSIQTYAIMFLEELGSGHGLIASSHLRLAQESLLSKYSSKQSFESEEVAAWGVLTLHTAWSGLTFQKPCAPVSTHANPFANIATDQVEDRWHMYTQPDNSDKELEFQDAADRKSFAILTARESAKLYLIVDECILVYCGIQGKISAKSLLDVYQRYIVWKENLPPDIRSVSGRPLPHVLLLHIQYHTAITQLLQPLLHINIRYQESHEQLVDLLVEHAKIGVGLLTQYKSMYTNFYLSPLQLFCLVHLCDAVVRYDGHSSTTPRTIAFCLTSLEEAKVGYKVAGPLQRMFRLSLTDYGIPVADELERMISVSARIGPEELVDACTRPTYRQPLAQVTPRMEPDLGPDFMNGWQHLAESRSTEYLLGEEPHSGSGRGKRVDIDSLLNT